MAKRDMMDDPVIQDFFEKYQSLDQEGKELEHERIYMGLGYLDSRQLLRPKGIAISDNFGEKHGNGEYISDRLLAVCVGIVENNWYTFPKAFENGGDSGFVYCAFDKDSIYISDHTEGEYMLEFVAKIGFSKDPQKRVKSLKTARPSIAIAHTKEAPKSFETFTHDTLSQLTVGSVDNFLIATRQYKSEWFDIVTVCKKNDIHQLVAIEVCTNIINHSYYQYESFKNRLNLRTASV